jgi:hypothetical protein
MGDVYLTIVRATQVYGLTSRCFEPMSREAALTLLRYGLRRKIIFSVVDCFGPNSVGELRSQFKKPP